MSQRLRVLVDLEVPDQVDVEKLGEELEGMFPGRVRIPEDNDLVVFFRPSADAGYVQWGTSVPPEIAMHCHKTTGQQLRPVDAGEVYYEVMGEVFAVAAEQYEKNQ